uniref:Uncharacterized protein n=1 Tax=Timema bartmani TaxID=61472 RepID=A0A7R9FDR9_9NEOP|nr:unnamed protein product [Timema bartmani]
MNLNLCVKVIYIYDYITNTNRTFVEGILRQTKERLRLSSPRNKLLPPWT